MLPARPAAVCNAWSRDRIEAVRQQRIFKGSSLRRSLRCCRHSRPGRANTRVPRDRDPHVVFHRLHYGGVLQFRLWRRKCLGKLNQRSGLVGIVGACFELDPCYRIFLEQRKPCRVRSGCGLLEGGRGNLRGLPLRGVMAPRRNEHSQTRLYQADRQKSQSGWTHRPSPPSHPKPYLGRPWTIN